MLISVFLFACVEKAVEIPDQVERSEAPSTADTAAASEPEDTLPDSTQFRLTNPTSLEDILRVTATSGAAISRIEIQYELAGTYWYTTIHDPESTDDDALDREIRSVRKATWLDLVADESEVSEDQRAQYAAAKEWVDSEDDVGWDFVPFSVELMGEADALNNAGDALADSDGFVLASDALWFLAETGNPHGGNSRLYATAPSDESWMADTGTLKLTSSSTAGYRTLTQTLKWDDISGFASSGDYSTYEHEFFLDNSDSSTYLAATATAWPNCYPSLKSSTHNFPSAAYAYLDTRLNSTLTGCDTNPLEFAFGLVYASKITKSSTYTVTMTMANGSATTDSAKAQGEIGYCNGYNILTFLAGGCSTMLAFGVDRMDDVSDKCVVPKKSSSACSTWDAAVPYTSSKSWSY